MPGKPYKGWSRWRCGLDGIKDSYSFERGYSKATLLRSSRECGRDDEHVFLLGVDLMTNDTATKYHMGVLEETRRCKDQAKTVIHIGEFSSCTPVESRYFLKGSGVDMSRFCTASYGNLKVSLSRKYTSYQIAIRGMCKGISKRS